MRITQKIIYDDFMRDINRNRGEMAGLQADLSSGKAVRLPSHEPVSFQRARLIEDEIRKQDQYQSNIDSGLRQARLAQESLDQVVDNLIDIKGIATKGSTGTTGEKARESMAEEVSGIRDSMISTLNLSYGDRYLFAGTNSAQAPFRYEDDLNLEEGVEENGENNNEENENGEESSSSEIPAPGGVANFSSSTPIQIRAGDGVSLDVSITGSELRESDAGDMFEIIGQLEQALRDNDPEAIKETISDIDQLVDHSAILTGKLGNNINRMEFMNEQYESTRIVKKADVSQLVDTDFAQAFSDMQRTQVSFEAAMAVHSNMIHNTLLDYI